MKTPLTLTDNPTASHLWENLLFPALLAHENAVITFEETTFSLEQENTPAHHALESYREGTRILLFQAIELYATLLVAQALNPEAKFLTD